MLNRSDARRRPKYTRCWYLLNCNYAFKILQNTKRIDESTARSRTQWPYLQNLNFHKALKKIVRNTSRHKLHVLKWNLRDSCLKGIPTCLHICTCTQYVPYIHLFRYFFLALETSWLWLPASPPNRHGEAGWGGGGGASAYKRKKEKKKKTKSFVVDETCSTFYPSLADTAMIVTFLSISCLRLSSLCVAGRGIASVSRQKYIYMDRTLPSLADSFFKSPVEM
jgi:hypothetical protein